MRAADAIREKLAECANELTIRDTGYDLSVEKDSRSVCVLGRPHSRFGVSCWVEGVEYGGGETEIAETKIDANV